MKTAYEAGRQYGEQVISSTPSATEQWLTPLDLSQRPITDIPADDYRSLVDSGIAEPSARDYWRGYNDALAAARP